jgi:hypothetical protein
MQTLLASIVAAVAGIAGTLLGAEMHRRTAREAREDARREQRHQDFLAALDEFTGAVGNLLDAEYDRAKKRIDHAPDNSRAEARQRSYQMRTSTWNAFYRLGLRAYTGAEHGLLNEAEEVIDKARHSGTESRDLDALKESSGAAKAALHEFVGRARRTRCES